MYYVKLAVFFFAGWALTACATTSNPLDTPQTRASSPSEEKRAVAEKILQQEKFVLASGPGISPPYTVEFYPQKGELKINGRFRNDCFPGVVVGQFFVSRPLSNVSVIVKSPISVGCPDIRFNVDPLTGVAGEISQQDGKWDDARSHRFYLQKD